MILAPTWGEWNLAKNGGSGERFVAEYSARMDKLGVNTIAAALESVGLTGTLVLLCFENLASLPPDGQKFVCHRRTWADWWTAQTGDPVPELSLQLELGASPGP
jgi:hypothetical protein